MEFEEYCEERGTRHVLNSSRHLCASGQVERVNRTITPLINSSIQDPTEKDWDQRLTDIEQQFNCAPNKTTWKSPFELLHGYQPRFHGAKLQILDHEDNVEWRDPRELQTEARDAIVRKTNSDEKGIWSPRKKNESQRESRRESCI